MPYIDMNQPRVYMCSPSWTRLPPPYLSHLSGSSQCTSPEHPVSCIEPGLVICFTYDNIHVSMLFSQIIPPSPSPTESKKTLYVPISQISFSQIAKIWSEIDRTIYISLEARNLVSLHFCLTLMFDQYAQIAKLGKVPRKATWCWGKGFALEA